MGEERRGGKRERRVKKIHFLSEGFCCAFPSHIYIKSNKKIQKIINKLGNEEEVRKEW